MDRMASNKVNVTADEETKSIYTISLDDIDVNLLTFDNVINKCEANNIKPLWSKNNLKKRSDNIYYQFEVIAEAINDGIGSSRDELGAHGVYNTYKKQKRADVAVQTERTQIKNNEAMNLNMYIKILNAINESSQFLSISVQNDNSIEIETPDGRLRITTDNFHGFFRTGSSIQCRACRTMVDDEYAHILSMKHLMLILKPINAAQGVRQGDDIFSHCILCNEIIENIELHAQCSEQHNLLLKNACTPTKSIHNKILTQDSKSKPICEPTSSLQSSAGESVVSTFFCDECFKEIPIIDIELHMNSDEHRDKQSNRKKKKFKQNARKYEAQKSSYDKTANYYNFRNTAAAYVNQKTYDKKLTSLEIENVKLKKETKELNQILNELHTKDTYFPISHHLIVNEYTLSVCYVCQLILNDTFYDISMHLSDHSHMCRYVEFLKHNCIIPTVLDYYCNACRQYVSQYSIVFHTESYHHKKHLRAIMSNKHSSVFRYVMVLLPIVAGFIYFKRRFL